MNDKTRDHDIDHTDVVNLLQVALQDLPLTADYIETAGLDFFDRAIDIYFTVNESRGIDEKPTAEIISMLVRQAILLELIKNEEAIVNDDGKLIMTGKWYDGQTD